MKTAEPSRTVKPGVTPWTGRTRTRDDHKPLSDILIRDLTAHRTLGLRLALSEQPEVAIVAVTHALSAQIFYRGADAHVLDIRPVEHNAGLPCGRYRGYKSGEGMGGSPRPLGGADAA